MARQPVDPTIDFHLPLFELLVQHLGFAPLLGRIHGLVVDVMNFGAVFEKYELIFTHTRDRPSADRLMSTELEYLFYNVRSLYDQLQRLIKAIWEGTNIVGATKKHLPDSFRDVAFVGPDDHSRSPSEMTERYGLPSQIAEFYHGQADFFSLCRAVRDAMAHHGKSLSDSDSHIFVLEGGFAVDVATHPYSGFACWPPESLCNNKLGCVRGLIAHIASRAISATSAYASALQQCVKLPQAIGPDWHMYIRSPHRGHLHRLQEYVERPWMSDSNLPEQQPE